MGQIFIIINTFLMSDISEYYIIIKLIITFAFLKNAKIRRH